MAGRLGREEKCVQLVIRKKVGRDQGSKEESWNVKRLALLDDLIESD